MELLRRPKGMFSDPSLRNMCVMIITLEDGARAL